MDLSKYNESQLALLWHTAHNSIEAMEKELKESNVYVTAKEIIDSVTQLLTQRLYDTGASSIATPHGTIHTVSKTTARIMDPEVFRDYVTAHQRWDMLDWKANMTACRSHMEETKKPVPGVELSSFRRLSITAPRAPKRNDHE